MQSVTGTALVAAAGGRPLAHAFRATSFAVARSGDAIADPVHSGPESLIPDREPDLLQGDRQWQQPPIPQTATKSLFPIAVCSPVSLFSTAGSGMQKAVSVAVGRRYESGIPMIGNGVSVRTFATNGNHRDIQIPDFSAYRRPSTSDPTKSSDRDTGRLFTYLVSGSLIASSVTFSKLFGTMFISNWSASKDVLAMSKIEVNLNEIPAGKNVVLKWRGKPLFIKHRTEEEIEKERQVDVSTLRDPERDEERVRGDPKWLVLLGVCTHLGCVPIAGQGDYGGYYCPCHGSHYDSAGRIRKGPAPLNLEIPEYTFQGDTLIVG